MTDISCRIQHTKQRIAAICAQSGRNPAAVQLLAVSKTQPATAVAEAFAAGQQAFGENYVQEAVAKINALHHLPIQWHLIGPLQSNKTAIVAAHFDWVHSVDRAKIAERLAAQRPAHLSPLNICIQVNIDGEDSKSGCAPAEVPALVQAILALPQLRLRGLMAIPRPENPAAFAALAALRQQLLANIAALDAGSFDTLSMGMSADLEQAVAAGSTLVRIGTAIFGERARKTQE